MILHEPTVIERNVKCPFCGYEHAMIISKEDKIKTGLGLPAYGLRSLLRLMYLGIFHIAISGFRIFQITQKKDTCTYGNTAQKSRRDTARSDIIRPWINR